MATPRRDRIAELEEKYAQALATINQLTVNNAAMSAQLGQGFGRTYASGGQLAVGIRNISNYTISLEDSTTGQLVLHDLHPEIPGRPDPKTRAVISYAYWQQLRTSRQYRLGLIVRDDSVLGPAENVAPPDREEDLPTEALINQVLEPKTYIESKSEEELRDAIEQMTSGPSIRRLIEAVDAEVQRLDMAVTTEQWLRMLRRKVADVDVAAQRRTDTQLLDSAADALLELVVRAVEGFEAITIVSSKANPATYGIQGHTDSQAMILLYSVAHDVLSSTYRQRVDRGELGISWTSGIESESSISAEKAYKQMLDELAAARDQLLITYQRSRANGRIQ